MTVAEIDDAIAHNDRRIDELQDELFELRCKQVSTEQATAVAAVEDEIRALNAEAEPLRKQRPELVVAELKAQLPEASKAVESANACRDEVAKEAQEAQRVAEQAGIALWHADNDANIARERLQILQGQLAQAESPPDPFAPYFNDRGRLTDEGMQRALRFVKIDHEANQLLAGYPVSFSGNGFAAQAIRRHLLNGGDETVIREHLESQPAAQFRDAPLSRVEYPEVELEPQFR